MHTQHQQLSKYSFNAFNAPPKIKGKYSSKNIKRIIVKKNIKATRERKESQKTLFYFSYFPQNFIAHSYIVCHRIGLSLWQIHSRHPPCKIFFVTHTLTSSAARNSLWRAHLRQPSRLYIYIFRDVHLYIIYHSIGFWRVYLRHSLYNKEFLVTRTLISFATG